MDDVALTHIFRVSSSLDSMVLGEPEITGQVKQAWAQAQEAGTTGRFLDAVMQKAIDGFQAGAHGNGDRLVRRFRSLRHGGTLEEVSWANLQGREVLLIGAGKMSDRAAHYLMKAGARQVEGHEPQP